MAKKTNSAVELSRQTLSPLMSTDPIPRSATGQSRKRKHDEITDCENLGDPFTIQVEHAPELLRCSYSWSLNVGVVRVILEIFLNHRTQIVGTPVLSSLGLSRPQWDI